MNDFISIGIKLIGSEVKSLPYSNGWPRLWQSFLSLLSPPSKVSVLCFPETLIKTEGASPSQFKSLLTLIDKRVVVWYRISSFSSGNVTL